MLVVGGGCAAAVDVAVVVAVVVVAVVAVAVAVDVDVAGAGVNVVIVVVVVVAVAVVGVVVSWSLNSYVGNKCVSCCDRVCYGSRVSSIRSKQNLSFKRCSCLHHEVMAGGCVPCWLLSLPMLSAVESSFLLRNTLCICTHDRNPPHGFANRCIAQSAFSRCCLLAGVAYYF